MSNASQHPRLPAASGPSGPVIPPKPPPTYSADRDVHLLDRLAILYRYRRVSGAVFVLTALVLMIQGYSNVTRYEAQARLLIEEERSTAVPGISSALDAYWEDPVPYYNTQYRILRGRELARRVVRKLQLQNVPEFNGTEPQTSTPRLWLHEARQHLVALVRPAPAPSEPPKTDETIAEAALIGAFLSRVRVAPVPDSKLVDVYFQAQSPPFTATAANTLVGVASFGGRAAYIGRVHDDELGTVFAHDLSSLDVAFDSPRATEGPRTGRCLTRSSARHCSSRSRIGWHTTRAAHGGTRGCTCRGVGGPAARDAATT